MPFKKSDTSWHGKCPTPTWFTNPCYLPSVEKVVEELVFAPKREAPKRRAGGCNDLDCCCNPSCQDLGNISRWNEFMKKQKNPPKMEEILNILFFFCPNFLDFRSVMFLFFGWFLTWLFGLNSSILWPPNPWLLSGTTRSRSPSPASELRFTAVLLRMAI